MSLKSSDKVQSRPDPTARLHERVPPTAERGDSDPLELIGKRQLARLLGVNPWTIDRWRKADVEFPAPIWLSNSTPRWRRADVERWLAAKRRGGIAPSWERAHAAHEGC
jgi:predicted DNA-binding transcriptional regulator AlpA